MISHKLKFIFIHIPKTGGSSLEKFLCNSVANKVTVEGDSTHVYCEFQDCQIKHDYIDYYHDMYGEKIKDYYKFAIVRNPYDLIMSLYFFYNHDGFDRNKFISYVEEDRNSFISQERVLQCQLQCNQTGKYSDYNHFRQYKYVTYKNRIDCNIIRYENFIEELKQIECLKSYDFNNYPKINCGSFTREYNSHPILPDRPQYACYYDEQLYELVYDKFKEDFETFNYKKVQPKVAL